MFKLFALVVILFAIHHAMGARGHGPRHRTRHGPGHARPAPAPAPGPIPIACDLAKCNKMLNSTTGLTVSYLYVDIPHGSATDADLNCENNGSSLPIFYSQTERDDFDRLTTDPACSCFNDVWIGLKLSCGLRYSSEVLYTWLDNKPLDTQYSSWDIGQPSNAGRCVYAHVSGDIRLWKSDSCSTPRGYFCQYRKPDIVRSSISFDGCCLNTTRIIVPSLMRYMFFMTPVIFDVALTTCLHQNSNLVVLKDQSSLTEFETLVDQCHIESWVGATRNCFDDPTNPLTYKWLDGTIVSLTNWITQPLNNTYPITICAQLKNDKLIDVKCAKQLPFVCQKRPSPLNVITTSAPICCPKNAVVLTPSNVQYTFHDTMLNFRSAANACEQINQSMTIFKTQQDMDELLIIAKNCDQDVWTGLKRVNTSDVQRSSYSYIDASPDINYHWQTTEPNESAKHCGQFEKAIGYNISDKKCIESLPFFCQRSQPYYCVPITVTNGNVIYINGINDSNGVSVNATAHVSCNVNFTLYGSNTTKCLQYGKWDTPAPKCKCTCPSIDIENGLANYTAPDQPPNSNATFKCDPTYRLTSDVILTCQANYSWNAVPPLCIKYCSGVTCNNNGQCFDQDYDYLCSCNYGYTGKDCEQANYCNLGITQPTNLIGRRKRQLDLSSSSLSDTIQQLPADFSNALKAVLNCTSNVNTAVDCINQTTGAILNSVVNNIADTGLADGTYLCGDNGICLSGSTYAICLCNDKYFGSVCQFKNCSGDPLTQWTVWSAWNFDDCTKSSMGTRTRTQTYLDLTDCVDPTTFTDTSKQSCPKKIVPDPMTPVERTIAIVFQTVGCIVLLIMVGITFTLFAVFRIFFLERMLHMCQEIALIVAHITLLIIMDLKLEKVECSIAGIALQYSFLANFTFLMLEALQTYSVLQSVVTTEGFFSTKVNFAIGWFVPFIVTVVTAVTKFDEYPSTYSCWVNLGDTVCAGTFVPLTIVAWSAVIMTEAAAMGDEKQFPLTPHEKYVAAHISQKMFVLKMAFNVLSWIFGMWSMYAQKVYLFGAVSAFNICLGVVVFLSHTSSNEKIIQYVKSKICKKKTQLTNTQQ